MSFGKYPVERTKSLFDYWMGFWVSDTDNLKYKKLPYFKGILGKEYIAGFTYVDEELYKELSKIMWIKPNHYIISNMSQENCKRLAISYKENKNKKVILHRFVLDIKGKHYFGDHINRLTLDNRNNNLRVVSAAENSRNSSVSINSPTGYKGVSKYKKVKFRSQIYFKGLSYLIGIFDDKESAAVAYDLVAYTKDKNHFVLNFPRRYFSPKSKYDARLQEVYYYLTKGKRGVKFEIDEEIVSNLI